MEYVFGILCILFFLGAVFIFRLVERMTKSRHKGGQLHKKNMLYNTIAKVFLKDIPD